MTTMEAMAIDQPTLLSRSQALSVRSNWASVEIHVRRWFALTVNILPRFLEATRPGKGRIPEILEASLKGFLVTHDLDARHDNNQKQFHLEFQNWRQRQS